MAQIADHDVVVELRGFPNPPQFRVGGKQGNAVTKSATNMVHRGWRMVAIDGKRVTPDGASSVLAEAQQRSRYSVTFRMGEDDGREDWRDLEARKRAEADEVLQRLEAQRQQQQLAEEEAARRRQLQGEEDAARRREAAEEAGRRLQEAEEEVQRRRREREHEEQLRREQEEAEMERRRAEAAEEEKQRREAEQLRREEEEKRKQEAAAAERVRQVEAAKRQQESEEAEAKRREEEMRELERKRREAEAAEARKREEEEQLAKMREEEEADRRRREAAEAERLRQEAKEAEEQRRAAERERREAEAAERRRLEAEEEERRQEKRRSAELAEKRRREAEAELQRRAAELERREVERRRAAQEAEERRRQAEVEEDERRKRQELEESRRRQAEAEEERALQAKMARQRQVAQKTLQQSTGLPPREKVAEPQKALMSALTNPQPAPKAKPNGPCDKCDGPHDTDACPHFKKSRDKHADAWSNYGKGPQDPSEQGQQHIVRTAKVVQQPGDGSCLFHSLSYGLGAKHQASKLRAEIADYIASSPDVEVAGNPLKDWVLWDTGLDTATYAKTMRAGSRWGGALELAVCARLKRVRVQVYERGKGGGFVRISDFDAGAGTSVGTVNVLYGGRVHYDALEI